MHELVGTTNNLDVAIEARGVILDMALADAIDEQMFLCDACDWWCGRDEESGKTPGVCDECAPEDDEDAALK